MKKLIEITYNNESNKETISDLELNKLQKLSPDLTHVVYSEDGKKEFVVIFDGQAEISVVLEVKNTHHKLELMHFLKKCAFIGIRK